MKKVLILFVIIAMIVSIFSGCDPFGGGYVEFNAATWTRTKDNMFFIKESDRDLRLAGGTEPRTDTVFVPPVRFGASSYTLQQSTDGGENWTDLTTTTTDTQDSFSTSITQTGLLRLKITGGQYDGQYSNTADLFLVSALDTQFAGTPKYTITNSFGEFTTGISVGSVPIGTVIDKQFTYQWYHLDPDDFENFTAIDGATSSTYSATSADNGYILVCRAVGDQVSTGGFIHLSLNLTSIYW